MKLAVIGKDVSQSTSPQIHSFIARELGREISYERISIPEERFASRIGGLLDSLDGFNVTIPFKLSVIPYLEKTVGDALDFGAVNTVLSAPRLGYNTDGLGFMQMLAANRVNAGGKRVLLLGAGGAGRSVAKKMSSIGAKLEIYDKNQTNALAVAKECGATALTEVVPAERDIIINATGVGMHKSVGVSPVTAEVIEGTETAVDLIYVPEKSEFLLIAEGQGKKIINGKAMLFYQAYYSDCLYFGTEPDSELAERLFEKYIKEGN